MTPQEEIAPLGEVPVEIEVELDRRIMTTREVLRLEEGSVIGTARSAGENIDIYIGGVLCGSGEIVVIENTLGVRITDFRDECEGAVEPMEFVSADGGGGGGAGAAGRQPVVAAAARLRRAYCRCRAGARDGGWSAWSGCRSGRSTRCTWSGWATRRCWWRLRRPAARWWRRCRAGKCETRREAARMKPARWSCCSLRRRPAAAGSRTALPARHIGRKNGARLSVPMQIVILLTLLTLLPAAVMSHHAVPAHHRRAALPAAGAGHADHALQPGAAGAGAVPDHPDHAAGGGRHVPPGLGADGERADHRRSRPWTRRPSRCAAFLVRFAREKDIRLFLEISHAPAPRTPADLDLKSPDPRLHSLGAEDRLPDRRRAVPAVSGDRPGGGSVTLSVGMVQLPPVMISAPFKILLFVLVDGWNLVVGSLMKSFYS